jgi:O-methyltransferase
MAQIGIRIVNRLVRTILKGYHVIPYEYCPSWSKLNVYDEPLFARLSSDDNVRKNSLLKADRLCSIYNSLKWIASNRSDVFRSLEVGVYKGGGSYFIQSCLTELAEKYNGHYAVDTFEGHDAADLPNKIEGDHSVSMFSDTSFKSVTNLLAKFENSVVLASRIQNVDIDFENIAFVHLDTDLHGPTKYVIEQMIEKGIAPFLILIDDYGFKTCPGVKSAVDEFVRSCPKNTFSYSLNTGQFIVAKVA